MQELAKPALVSIWPGQLPANTAKCRFYVSIMCNNWLVPLPVKQNMIKWLRKVFFHPDFLELLAHVWRLWC